MARLRAGQTFKLNIDARPEPAWDAAYLSKVDYDLWLGPAAKTPFNVNRFHYNWHWNWSYGNGDTGNQGPHQFDIARWGLGKMEHPAKVSSFGGYFGPESAQETPNVQTSLFEYADGTVLEFGTRGEATNDEGTVKIGNLFYGSEGWMWVDGDGRKWQSYKGRSKDEKGPGSEAPPSLGRQRPERALQHRVAALPELRRRHPRQQPEAPDVRHHGGPPVLGPAAPGQHRLPRRPPAPVRRQVRDVRQRQGRRQAAHPRVPQGLRAQAHSRAPSRRTTIGLQRPRCRQTPGPSSSGAGSW